MMVASSGLGMTRRTSRSIWATIWVVSSTRVPAGGRACRVIWPESTVGKKSSPRKGTSSIVAATGTEKADTQSGADAS